jgi:hypothetical protein
MFVSHMTMRAHWKACRRRIDALGVALIFIDNIVHRYGVLQAVVSDCDLRFTADDWRQGVKIL